MATRFRRLVGTLASTDLVVRAAGRLATGVAPVFMMHRFADPEAGNTGHSATLLREFLKFLRRNRFRVVSIADLCAEMERPGSPVRKTVALTVDDGYRDFSTVAAPIFREFDCPVTVFLTTGFIDGSVWQWWDKVEHLLSATDKLSVTVPLKGESSYYLDTPESRKAAAAAIVERLKSVPNGEKEELIQQISLATEVVVPDKPPEHYEPLTWDDVRSLGGKGVTFGPHTVTHPILSQVSAKRADWEIRESWFRVRTQTSAFVPVFCYPNGTRASFSERDWQLLRSAGMSAAVTSIDGYVRERHFAQENANARYMLPRFPFGSVHGRHVRTAAGMERLRRSSDDRMHARRTEGEEARRPSTETMHP